MLLTLKPEHADVKRISATIADLEKQLETESLEAPISAGGGARLSPAAQLREKRMADLRAQIEQVERQTARKPRGRRGVAETGRRVSAPGGVGPDA